MHAVPTPLSKKTYLYLSILRVGRRQTSRIHNTSLTTAYFGLDNNECEYLEPHAKYMNESSNGNIMNKIEYHPNLDTQMEAIMNRIEYKIRTLLQCN
jgi:hypothetical protein